MIDRLASMLELAAPSSSLTFNCHLKMSATLCLWPGSGVIQSCDAASMQALYLAQFYASSESAELSITHKIPFGIQSEQPQACCS